MRRLVMAATPLAFSIVVGVHSPLLPAFQDRAPELLPASPAGLGALAPSKDADAFEAYVLGVAHVAGLNQTQWRSSLEMCNFGPVRREFELAFLARGEDNSSVPGVTLALVPGKCQRFDDVVSSIFGLDEAAGAIRVTADGDGLVVMARTYNETADGTYGSAQAPCTESEVVTSGASAVLTHLEQAATDDTGYRSNLELLNASPGSITVEVDLHRFTGTLLGSLSIELPPYGSEQLSRVFRQVTADEVSDGYAVVWSTTPGAAFAAEASLVDNRTGDGTTIRALPMPDPGPWHAAENLGPLVNSSANDWYPTIARDGSFMVFVSDRAGGYGSCDLYISRRVGGEWQEPENLGPTVNTVGCESAPFLGPDDRTLYFASFAEGGQGGMDVWWCTLEDGVAGERVNMGAPINGPHLDCCPVLSSDGNTLFICSDRPGGSGSMDVWVAHKVGGVWQEPVNLGSLVNTAATDCPRWISDDGATLVLSSTRWGGFGGADLWSVQWDGTVWSAAVNLGLPINSSGAEWGPGFLDNHGTLSGVIHFGSGRAGGEGGWDIWRSEHRSARTKRGACALRRTEGASAQPTWLETARGRVGAARAGADETLQPPAATANDPAVTRGVSPDNGQARPDEATTQESAACACKLFAELHVGS